MKVAVLASGGGSNLQALLDARRDGRLGADIVLVVSSREGAPALERARAAGVPTLLAKPSEHASRDAYWERVAAECRAKGADLVCLAGFMLKLTGPMLKAFPGRILNVHPSLLPAFGGQGLYGPRVHEAVLAAGAKVSGCTVHLVDEHYDHGPILLQSAVPVLAGDTPGTLAARVLAQEHRLYPRAVRLFAEGRVRIERDRAEVLPARERPSRRVCRALLSVSDKTGLVEFARGLRELGIELVSTSGTAKALREAGLSVRPLEDLTGWPEMLGGRVKTLHPVVHGGILFKREDPEQAGQASLWGIEPIDLVVVNLYPFERTAAAATAAYAPEVIEDIDIGGVALIRAAAKNFEGSAVAVSPEDYPAILEELRASSGELSLATRKRLSLSGFRHTARYDAAIAGHWDGNGKPGPTDAFPETMTVRLKKIQSLRYGENPHQKAALYVRAERGKPSFRQLHGKELSYNNLLDAFGAWDAVQDLKGPAAVVFKHVTPCGAGLGKDIAEAFARAWACDPLSAFGGIAAFNGPVPAAVAEAIGKNFMEVLVAPSFEPGALELLKKKPNLRLLVMESPPTGTTLLRSLGDEVLATDPDRALLGSELKCVSKRKPTPAEEKALLFAWAVAKFVRSNAIVLAGPEATVAIGAGQMSRVDAVQVAGIKLAAYREKSPPPEPLVLASDAFFPFRDGIDTADGLGVSAVIQPGGSVRDADTIAAADEHGMAMLFTGMRHFRH